MTDFVKLNKKVDLIISNHNVEHWTEFQKEIKNIAEIACSKWTLNNIRVLHRYGSLKPNDNIVLVITGSSHRSDSMSANQFIMDFLKSSAPFWKKEIYPLIYFINNLILYH